MEKNFDNNESGYGFSPRREGSDRFNARRDGSRESRPRFNRDGNSYGNRPRYNSENGESRPRYNSYSDGESRPRYNSYNNNNSERRPRYNSYNSENGESRPRYNSYNNDNSERRPRYNSENGESRPRFNRNNDGEGRPRFNRFSSEGGDREQRPRYNSGEGRPRFNRNNDGESRPRFNRNNDGEGRPRFNRNNDGEGRPRFNRNNDSRNGRSGYSESRPRFNKDHGFHARPVEGQQRSSITEDLFVENEMAAVAEETTVISTKMRLNRYIAMAGICSRREADELIKQGFVKVNGQVVTEMGVTLQKDDVVEYQGRQLQAERKVYVLLNKPKDTVTTTDDPEDRRTVIDLVEGACEERIYPVGRLDRNTTGVILLTNDGELTEKLMHPRYGVRKIYHVFLDKHVTEDDMRKMVDGLELEDGPIAVDDVRFVDNADKKQVGVQIHSGRNRIVRRIFEHLGYTVEKLDRVYFAGLTKLNLPRGKWRFLTDAEVNKLKAGFYK
ncbi:MAG: pseudouridine synthase [Bacteroidales bacterium]|nr:pseudouridine synthase [Bacteroidales bacterium]